ncbi:MAG: hypothetical protein IPP66_16200 [Anaerolineales bacterium]|nr:hypothetical protein [Anaerolineales bacterium]
MIGNESLVMSLDEDAAGELFSWGEAAVKTIVDQTDALDDPAADEYITPRLRALRLMMRAMGRWVGETKTLDTETKHALWNRIGEQARALFGDAFVMPSMEDATQTLSQDANAQQMIIWLKNFIDEITPKG